MVLARFGKTAGVSGKAGLGVRPHIGAVLSASTHIVSNPPFLASTGRDALSDTVHGACSRGGG